MRCVMGEIDRLAMLSLLWARKDGLRSVDGGRPIRIFRGAVEVNLELDGGVGKKRGESRRK